MLVIVLASGIGYWLYGPIFRISSVTVSGTKLVDPNSVHAWVERYLQKPQWLIIPGDQSAVLSTTTIGNELHQAINQRLSVETVTVKKVNRHELAVTIIERQALFVWQSGSALATIDRNGIIIGPVESDQHPDLPQVVDETGLPIDTDSSVVKPEVISAMESIQGEAKNNNLDVDHLIVPHPQCTETPEANTNANLNASEQSNSNASTNTNVNAGNENIQVNGNVNQGIPIPSIIICDTIEARSESQEVWMQLKGGPKVYFDRHENIAHAMQAVAQLLEDPKNRTASYIDARFEERIYIH